MSELHWAATLSGLQCGHCWSGHRQLTVRTNIPCRGSFRGLVEGSKSSKQKKDP